MADDREKQLKQAYKDWLANRAYFENGRYKLKSNRRASAPWSKAVTATYGKDPTAFHNAAHRYESGTKWPHDHEEKHRRAALKGWRHR